MSYLKPLLATALTIVGIVHLLSGGRIERSIFRRLLWNTPLTRDDNGAGACELMYVESATLR